MREQGLNLEISGSVDPAADHDGLQRALLEKQLLTRKWQSLRKSEQAATTPEQITLTPGERADLVKKLYNEAWADGKITPALIAANTNLAAVALQIQGQKPRIEKGATILANGLQSPAQKSSRTVAAAPSQLKLPPIANPEEVLLLATIPVTESDLETLAANRAKTVRSYILATGKVESSRLFLTENQTGGVRSDGSRVYLEFR